MESIVNLPREAAHRPGKTLSVGRREGAVMKTPKASIAAIALGLAAGLLASCGGGYGGGGGGNGGPPATLNISIDPDAITLGESATITWNSNGNSCDASGDWTGMKAGDGNEVVTPDATGEFTYSLTCSGGGYRDSQEGTVTLTVEAAVNVSALFSGEACCVDDAAVGVTVLTSRSGEFRLLTRGMQAVGEAGKPSRIFDASDSQLAGRRLMDAGALEQLALTEQGSVRGTILVKDRAGVAQRLRFTAAQDPGFERKTDLAALQGIYTTALPNGYVLTLTIDRSGEINGTDSRGCTVRGMAVAPRSSEASFGFGLEVSSCGASNGRFLGRAALIDAAAGRPAALFLSASNENAAIGWRLAR